MSQSIECNRGGTWQSLVLPNPNETVLPGVRWGRVDALYTPAYWFGQLWLASEQPTSLGYRLGRSLIEEVVACLLGGHGIPAEVGIAAFHRLRDAGFTRHPCDGRA